MSRTAQSLLNHLEQELLVKAIQKAEANTTGEIRVHLEDATSIDVLDRTSQVFVALAMHETKHRNAVLIYVAVCQGKFSIVGDMGFNSFVPENFWADLSINLSSYFQKHLYLEGLSAVVKQIGETMKIYFPLQHGTDNPNELPDSISFGQ